jgi:Zn finger protein HypA/HybF involved in hydrogenase expression
MKTVNSITTVLKIVIKYGALIAVAVKVIQFAIDEIEKLNIKEEPAKEHND